MESNKSSTRNFRGLYWFSYAAPESQLRRGRRSGTKANIDDCFHMHRDGSSFILLANALASRYSFEFTDIIPNYPFDVFGLPQAASPKLCSTDLLVITTRPPLNDDREVDRRAIARSNSLLENAVLDDTLGKSSFFWFCSRKQVILDTRVRSKINDQNPEYGAIEFHQNVTATYKRFCHANDRETPPAFSVRPLEERMKSTAGYLIYVPHIESSDRSGPALLVVFGMNGTTNLLSAALLCSKGQIQDRLYSMIDENQPALVIFEFEPNLDPELPVTVFSAARHAIDSAKIKVDVVI